MNKKITQFRWLAALLLLVAAMVMPSVAWADTITPTKPTTGDGSAGSPYKIGTAAELYWFAAIVNGDTSIDGVAAADKAACAKLTQNITVNSGVLKSDGSLADEASGFTAWTPISTNDANPYTGTFDGNGYTISGLYFIDTSGCFIGFFGFVGSGSKICNVGIVDSYFKGDLGIGGVCGYCTSGEITNCYNTGTVIGIGSNIGGVCGYNSGTITDCYNTGNVSGMSTSDQEGCVGGVCGCNDSDSNMSTITRSYNSGKVSGVDCVGGVCGANGFAKAAQTVNCYNTGEVTGTGNNVGGICGYNGASGSRIENCYNSAAVSGGSNVGSVCGLNHAIITTCYYLTTESALSGVGGSGTYAVSNAYGKNAGQFRSGEVAWLLNGSKADGTQAWYQNIENDVRDDNPVLDSSHGTVYASTPCPVIYSNTEAVTKNHNHVIDGNGFLTCTACGDKRFQEATQNASGEYEIGNAGQLYWFANKVNTENGTYGNANAVLTADITVNKDVLNAKGQPNGGIDDFIDWTPIGQYDSKAYSGTFDGQGHTISGLWKTQGHNYIGLFGYNTGTIKNIGVVDSYFNGNNYVGGVCGGNSGSLTNCYNTSRINGHENVSGVCGYNYNNGTITNCYNSGKVIYSFDKAGGICGSIGVNSSTINCYYDSNIYSEDAIGYNPGGTVGEDVMGKTTAQFKSGEVAYLLNGSSPNGGWGQQIGTNDYPLIGSPYKVLRAAQDGQDGTNYWATFSNLNSNAELIDSKGDITVYNATVSAGTLTLNKRSNKVSSGEGVLLKANCEYVNAKNISDYVAATTEDNHLVATPATAQTITAETGYTLYRLTYNKTATKEGLGFYLGLVGDSKDGSQLAATPGKAYLKVLTSEATLQSSAAPARGFAFPGDGETTGIECITVTDESLHSNGNAEGIFDLQGRKVSKPTKGVYINNGKKVIIK